MIYLGADHGGYELKEKIKTWLTEWGYKYEDKGPTSLDPNDDYPDFAFLVADEVGISDSPELKWDKRAKGILICRSAAGMIIAANKVTGVRAVAVTDGTSAKHAREHNDANVIGLSGDWLNEESAKQIVKTFLTTDYSHEERHQRRLDKITAREMEGLGGCCGGGGCGGGCS